MAFVVFAAMAVVAAGAMLAAMALFAVLATLAIITTLAVFTFTIRVITFAHLFSPHSYTIPRMGMLIYLYGVLVFVKFLFYHCKQKGTYYQIGSFLFLTNLSITLCCSDCLFLIGKIIFGIPENIPHNRNILQVRLNYSHSADPLFYQKAIAQ